MDDDWESADFVQPPAATLRENRKDTWDDEDASEGDVKESWEDEEASAPEQNAKSPANSDEAQGKTADIQYNMPADPISEKFKQQRHVGESDDGSTPESFRNSGNSDCLEFFIPKSEKDFLDYGELIAHKMKQYEKSFHYTTLLKDVIRHAMAAMKSADAKEVASTMTAISSEKLKAEKEANAAKKKSGVKKKQLNVDKPDDDAYAATYDDLDEYDFM